ncbi:MAG: glutamyl-tRNA amidotransferase [Hyphomicrobiales bacterium]|nr:MAG: glutamyl-tRNA amidotransferase [Hyphomicrobiales bacterium]
MREAINSALKAATKAQEKRRMSTLRLINAAIKDREIAVRGQGKDGIGDDEILQILAKMVKQRDESAATYEEAGRLELAEGEREEIAIIQEFLPKQLDDEAVKVACAEVVAEIGAQGLRDMGRTMAVLKERYPGQMDFGRASGFVKELLQSA